MRSVFLLTVGLALAGCAVETSPEAAADTSNQALASFATPFVGTYARTDGGTALADLTLRSDGSYGSDDVVYCLRAPCPLVHTEGRWSVHGSGSSGKLSLTRTGGATRSYGVTLDGALGSLALVDSSGKTFEEVRAPKTCGGLASLACSSGFTCVYPGGITYPDEGGECIPRGGSGTTCGGIAALPCFRGLTCQITETYPDASGTCVVE